MLNRKLTCIVLGSVLVLGLTACSSPKAASEAKPTPTKTALSICSKYHDSLSGWEQMASSGSLSLSGFDLGSMESDIHEIDPSIDVDYKDDPMYLQPSKVALAYLGIFGECMSKTLNNALVDYSMSKAADGD